LGGGRTRKWSDIEQFIDDRVRYYWECGVPLTSEQLLVLVEQHVTSSKNPNAIKVFVQGKRNTMHKFIARVLKRNHWSLRKISITQSVPVDWHNKAEEQASS
jgi:hypothetical protein